MKNGLLSLAALGACLLLPADPSRAAVSVGASNVQIGGFLSQGYLHSSDNNQPTADKGGTWDFREMAVNVSTTYGDHLRLGGQLFAQRLGNLGGDKAILDWAQADYNFRQEFGLRAGRVKYPKGLYGETLDLDLVRPYVFLPGSIYSPVLRDFSSSFDGGMIYGTINAGKSSFDYKVFHGDIPMSPEKGVAEFYNSSGLYASAGVTKLSIDSVTGGQLAWNTPVSGLKFVYSHSYFSNLASDGPFSAYAAANLHSNFSRYRWNTVSAEYAFGDWSFATEWQNTGGALAYAAAPVLPTVNDKSGWEGWYVAAARRFLTKFEAGAYYSYINDRYTSNKSAPGSHKGDTAVCLRYDANEHITLKAEVHWIEGGYQTFNTVRIPNPGAQRTADTTLFALKTTLSF